MTSHHKNASRFICYLALRHLVPVSLEAIADRYLRLFPVFARQHPISGDSPQVGQAPNILSLGQHKLVLLNIDAPLPADAWEFPLKQNLVWAEARQAIAQHKAHIIVSAFEGATSPDAVMTQARLVSVLSAVMASLSNTAAVIWNEGRVIHEPQRFIAASNALESGPPSPDLWTGMFFGQGKPTSRGEQTFGVMTTGLVPFFGREIEFEPAPVPMMTIAERLMGVIQYLFMNGPVLKDGDTLGISPSERIRIKHLPETVRPDVPVMKLVIERLEQL